MKLIVESTDTVTVLDSNGNTAVILTEENGIVTVDHNNEEPKHGLNAAADNTPTTLRERVFSLIETYNADDEMDKKEASKLIARELFGTAGKKNLQRVAAYRASHTRSQQD